MTVLKFPVTKKGDTVDEMLEGAVGVYQDVILLGYRKDGGGSWEISKDMSNNELVFLLEALKFRIMNGALEGA